MKKLTVEYITHVTWSSHPVNRLVLFGVDSNQGMKEEEDFHLLEGNIPEVVALLDPAYRMGEPPRKGTLSPYGGYSYNRPCCPFHAILQWNEQIQKSIKHKDMPVDLAQRGLAYG